MVARGYVQNGVVVLDGGIRLPEGQEVTVLTTAGAPPDIATAGVERRPGGGELTAVGSHSILEIAPVSLGPVLRPLTPNDDLLGEMLEGRS